MKPQPTIASLLHPEDDLVKTAALIEAMIEKYSHGLVPAVLNTTSQTNGQAAGIAPHVVLLTGSTGSLGSYLLSSLLENNCVLMVYAFNRSSKQTSIQQRQREAFKEGGFSITSLESKKLVFIEADASQPDLGLPHELYDQIRQSVTLVIHNAWPIHLTFPLSSFEPNVRATRNLIDLALTSQRNPKPRFMFTSSVLSAFGWDRNRGAYPEEIQYDARAATTNGYGASKYVCERVLAKSGLSACSFRIGQICGGPPRWGWSTTEWVAAMVKCSLSMGVFPDCRGFVSWITPQTVSDAILDVAFAKGLPPPAINLVHPTPIPWNAVIKVINKTLQEAKVTEILLPVVPLSKWINLIKVYVENTSTREKVEEIPIMKAFTFFSAAGRMDKIIRASGDTDREIGGIPMFATSAAQKACPTLRDLPPLSSLDIANWVKNWKQEGLFSERNDLTSKSAKLIPRL